MSDDVKAAAERIRQLPKENLDVLLYRGGDVGTVVAAYLAEHDPTPIDEAWLMGVGFQKRKSMPEWPATFRIKFRELPGEGCDIFCYLVLSAPPSEYPDWGFNATVAGGGQWPGPTETRGDIRRLCAALNIHLKETP